MLLSGRGSRAAIGAAVLAALLLAPLAGRAAAVTYEQEPAFCLFQIVPNPAPAFAGMPKLHQPSAGGRIGFGPPGLRLRTTPAVRVGGGEVGFSLGLAQRRGLSLPWTAKVTITEVDRKGRPTGKPRRLTRKVGWIKPTGGDRFMFGVSDDAAFYRTTILLIGGSGQKLGKFSFYTQMMLAEPEARLNLNASSYRPESDVFMRVENLGNLSASYGYGYQVEKLEGSSWGPAPENPHGAIPAIAFISPPKTLSRCFSFPVPATMPPGQYRIAKEISFILPYSGRRPPQGLTGKTKATLTAEFQVAP